MLGGINRGGAFMAKCNCKPVGLRAGDDHPSVLNGIGLKRH